jgi:hypothetical protein
MTKEKAFGLLIRLAVKTGMRAWFTNLEYIQFKENRISNTFTLEYSITKTKSKNIIPVGAELMRIMGIWTWRQNMDLQVQTSWPQLLNW